jgi:hypothetical protein
VRAIFAEKRASHKTIPTTAAEARLTFEQIGISIFDRGRNRGLRDQILSNDLTGAVAKFLDY